MRKVVWMLLILFSISSFAEGTSGDKDKSTVKDVVLDKGDSMDHSSERPRTLIPILCTYANGGVQLVFLEDLGEYTLTVTNQQTGECWSAINALVLPTSTANGIYWVEIETGDGTLYYGTYIL